jgi:hypothetical protein
VDYFQSKDFAIWLQLARREYQGYQPGLTYTEIEEDLGKETSKVEAFSRKEVEPTGL